MSTALEQGGRIPDPSPLDPAAPGRMGPWFAALWLFFLLEPLAAGWQQRTHVGGVLGMVATLAFGAVYLALWVRTRRERHRLAENPPLRVALRAVVTLTLLGVAVVALLGEPGLACSVYLAIACVMVFPLRVAAPLVLALALVVVGLGPLAGWGSQVGTAFGVLAGATAILGLRAVLTRNVQLVRAHQENARLAVDNERSRFARDLHDILGHSLTVITVKAELARRLLDLDPDRARTELADLERLARDALVDVRRAVEGYRELTLPGELARARTALETAGIEADLPGTVDEVPGELRELFAWTVREGVTNVIRHSGARHCRVRLGPGRAEVSDDGRGGSPGTPGSGLAGLHERAAAVGATVVTRQLQPGFALEVVR